MRSTAYSVLFVMLSLAGTAFAQEGDSRPGGAGVAAQPKGLQFRLTEATFSDERQQPVPEAPSQPLSPERLRSLLARLPAFEAHAEDQQATALRTGSTPPPRGGETLLAPWPPQADVDAPDSDSPPEPVLRVARHAPEGEVALVPHLSITFSQPMLAVSSHQSASAQVPVRIEPQPPGVWRWLGTRTLVFEPEGGRFPMATEYRVSVPAGTQSVVGGQLQQAHEFRFATPAPTLQLHEPRDGPHALRPFVLMQFDQAIDPAQVIEATRLVGPEGRSPALRRVDPGDMGDDPVLQALRSKLVDGRWLAMRPAQPLAAATTYRVEVAAGVGSLEGPRVTPRAQGWQFSTFAPLALEGWHCGWRDDQRTDCDPDSGWSLRFSNPLDVDAFDPASLQVEPAVEDLQAHVMGSRIAVHGSFVARTRYRLTVPAQVQDRFGQTLVDNRVVEFRTGDAEPALLGPGRPLVTLDPQSAPTISVYSRGFETLDVELYRVRPEQWPEYQRWQQTSMHQARAAAPPGTRVSKRQVRPQAAGRLSETVIGLDSHLDAGFGHLVLRVRPSGSAEFNPWAQVVVWLQSTRIGLVAVSDDRRLTAWASELDSGRALPQVRISLPDESRSALTGTDGLARLDLPANSDARMLIARLGDDAALLPRAEYAWDESSWQARDTGEELRWLVFDDRGMYRPGEQAHVKGWLRRLRAAPQGDLQTLGANDSTVHWRLQDSRGVELAKGQSSLSALGGFDFAIDLPDTPNLGPASLILSLQQAAGSGRADYRHSFQIQEFRRPEYEVKTQVDAGPHLVGGRAHIEVAAHYYAGGALSAAPVNWELRARPTRYAPPNHSDWSFGDYLPWWRPHIDASAATSQSLTGATGPLGRHQVHTEFLGVDPPRPSLLIAEARVTDLNRQAWSSRAEVLVHPAEHYVGLRSRRSFVHAGQPIEVEALVVDIDGKRISDAAPVLGLSRLVWKQQGQQWREEPEPGQPCSPQRSDGGVLVCRWTPRLPGSYRIDALVKDAQGRGNGSELRVWVAGGEGPPARNVELQDVLLVPDRKDPRPGETLQVFVQAPFAVAEGLLTLVRGDVLEQRRFPLDQGSATLDIPILESMVPGFELQVAVVGQAARVDDKGQTTGTRPAAASASLLIGVPPLARTLQVSATPRETVLAPGGRTHLSVQVRDAANMPVPDAELAVVVVDEAVLALSGHTLPDPLAVFYAAWPGRVDTRFQHPQVLLAESPKRPEAAGRDEAKGMALDQVVVTGSRLRSSVPMRSMAPMPAPAPAPAEAAGQGAPIALRSDFNALALFAPEVRTDAQGRAELALKLPDSLTRYRVMVVAVSGARAFGSAESSVTARQPLMLRPSPPRFLNFGDRIELPLLVQNQTDQPMQVELGLRARNANVLMRSGHETDAEPSTGRWLQVPAQGRVEVRIPVSTRSAGRARFQAVASAGDATDAQSFDLPVWTSATREAFATYGSLDEQTLMVQPVRRPDDAIAQFGGLRVGLASTELQALTDALLYLVEYPFDCNEQRASRVLAIAALRDVMQAFGVAEVPAPEALDEAVQRDVQRLADLQNADGGWGFWRQDQNSWPFLSVHVAHALARAGDKGYPVPPDTRQRALRYLQQIERHLPAWYQTEARRSLRAYALDVRRRLGDPDPVRAEALLAEAGTFDGLSIESVGWLLPSLDTATTREQFDALLRYVEQQVSETAGTAQFVTARSEQGAHVLLHSDRRADGVMLDALLDVRPQHDLIEKLARGLLAHRVQGRWSTTQDNAFVLLAMDRYFRQREGVPPDFVARVWLDQGFAGEHAFRGRSTDRVELRIPMAELARAGTEQPLIVQKQGTGRLYYRIGLDYAPQALQLDAADHGFAVQRRYVALDDPADVRRDAGDGRWRIRAGARVRVELDMVAPARRYHVALVDPLPAGLEAINPTLSVSESVPVDPQQAQPFGRWQRTWYEHQNLRDERVEAFASLLWEGVHRYSYVARATTPGEYIVPPARAEEMYQPETFGRSRTDRVVIDDGANGTEE